MSLCQAPAIAAERLRQASQQWTDVLKQGVGQLRGARDAFRASGLRSQALDEVSHRSEKGR